MGDDKLTVLNTEYILSKDRVSCKLTIVCECIMMPDETATYYGTATYHKDDVYDVELGKKIALAKAERAAYKDILKFINLNLPDLKHAVESMSRLKEKAVGCIEHNSEYIKRISQ